MRRRLILALCLLTCGCAGSGGGPLGIGAIVGDRNLAAAEPLFSEDEERCLGSADKLMSTVFGATELSTGNDKRPGPCDRMRQNFQAILGTGAMSGQMPRYEAPARNELIDTLIAASNRQCIRYTELLKNSDGAMNAGLSLAAIISGGLGSFVGGAATAKALAGSSSIFGGSRAALNEVYLTNQTIHVLMAAFEKARRAQRREITNREACDTTQYTLMRGIEDAFEYHRSCSIVVGLSETARSIERSENPGVEAMRLQFREMAALRQQAAELAKATSPTPIAAAPEPISLAKVTAADQAMTAATAALRKAQDDQTELKGKVVTAQKALSAQTAIDKSKEVNAIKMAEGEVVKKSAAVLALTDARDKAGRELNTAIAALVSATPLTSPPIEPETRTCPFDVAAAR